MAFLFPNMTRDEAKAAGLTRYNTGKPCLRGHLSERFVSIQTCCQCLLDRGRDPKVKALRARQYKTNAEKIAARNAAYRQANPEKIAAQVAASKAWGEANAEKIAEYRKANAGKIAKRVAAYYKANAKKIMGQHSEYRQANAEKIAEKIAAYRQANPHLLAAQKAKRRAQKIQATPPWADFEAIKAVYRLCAEVTRITGEKNHVDHIIPLISKKVCGLHVAANLQILTASDNLKKSNKLLPMYQTPESAVQ